MKILYFDLFSGISGDMTLGALIDAGVDFDMFRRELDKLGLHEFEITAERKTSHSISGIDISVTDLHGKAHGHGHEHSHGHDHVQGQGHSHERNPGDIYKLIEDSGLSRRVKDMSTAIFRTVAAAEAKVHGISEEEVHFHEVGAVDSIVDIVGAAVCLEMLAVDKVYASILHDGSGTIKCRHGLLPVPVPAVAAMLAGSGIEVVTEDVGTELVTPTGMAIIKNIASGGFGKMPPMAVDAVGYGLGKRETGRLNALRVVLGHTADEAAPADDPSEKVEVVEANIDDMSPEQLAFAMEKLFAAGALDVTFTPIYMKKNRPGVMLSAITKPGGHAAAADVMLRETTTLGVRWHQAGRVILTRYFCDVETKYGTVKMKIAVLPDGGEKVSPEYESCATRAREHGIALRDVFEEAAAQYRTKRKSEG